MPDGAAAGRPAAQTRTGPRADPAVDGFWHLWNALPQFVHLVVDPNRSEERAAWSSFSQVLGRLYDRDRSASLCDFVRWSEEESFEAQPLLDFRDQGDDRLTVTTLHQSKGLEFEVVFIADAVDGVFPDLRSRESLIGTRHLAAHLPTDPNEYRRFRLQEETRLAYTAMTRARLRVVWTATTAGLDEGEGAPSSAAGAPGTDDTPGSPPDEDRLPVTTGQAEAWLRRIAADPAATGAAPAGRHARAWQTGPTLAAAGSGGCSPASNRPVPTPVSLPRAPPVAEPGRAAMKPARVATPSSGGSGWAPTGRCI